MTNLSAVTLISDIFYFGFRIRANQSWKDESGLSSPPIPILEVYDPMSKTSGFIAAFPVDFGII